MLKNYRYLIEMVAKNPIETDPFEGPSLYNLENSELFSSLLSEGQVLYL